MLKLVTALWSAALILAPAMAGALSLTATSKSMPTLSSFSIVFSDANGDGMFTFPEMQVFSGMDFEALSDEWTPFPILISVPAIAGVTDGSGSDWVFADAPHVGAHQGVYDVSNWDYQISYPGLPDPKQKFPVAFATAPLPGSLPFALAGIAALVALRRCRATGSA